MNPLKYLPGRRTELLLVTVLIVALVGLMLVNTSAAPLVVVLTLEALLPIALGVIVAGLLANDPALDLLLSVPQPAPRTLATRLLVVLGCGAALGLLVQAVVWAWALPLSLSWARQLFVWGTPIVWWTGLATASALVRGRMRDGLTVTLGTWGGMVAWLQIIQRNCIMFQPTERCPIAITSPMMTLVRPFDGGWPLNRAIWLLLGLALLAVGLSLARHEERLTQAAQSE